MPHVRFLLGRSLRPSVQQRLNFQGVRPISGHNASTSTANPQKPRRLDTASRDLTREAREANDKASLLEQHREPQRLGRYILNSRLATKRYDFKPLTPGQANPASRRLRWLRRQYLYLVSAADRGHHEISALRLCNQIASFAPAGSRPVAALVDGHNIPKPNAGEGSGKKEVQVLTHSVNDTSGLTLAEYRDILRTFNAVFLRFENQEESASLARYGQLLSSAARNATAFKYYTDLLLSHGQSTPVLLETCVNLQAWLDNELAADHNKHEREALREIVLGPSDSKKAVTSAEGFRHLCSLWDRETRCSYLGILAKLDPQSIFHDWRALRNSARWRKLRARAFPANSTPPPRVDSDSARADVQKLLHDVVTYLILGNEPGLAWNVVRDLEPPFEEVMLTTWSLLLEYPEHLSVWSESMREPVLQKYEEQLSELEKTLGVEWSGGEDGSHSFVGEDQGSIDSFLDYQSSKS